MDWIFLDVETTPDFTKPPDLAKVRVDGRLKDPAKINHDRMTKAHRAWSDQAKDITAAKVFVICAETDGGDAFSIVSPDEKTCILALEEWLGDRVDLGPYAPAPLCAYNGVHFDFPLLASRAAKYTRNKLARRLMVPSRWGGENHRDPYLALGRQGSLRDWCSLFEIESTPDPEGLYDDWALVKLPTGATVNRNEYVLGKCREDVSILRQLCDKLRAGGLMT